MCVGGEVGESLSEEGEVGESLSEEGGELSCV